MTEAEQLALVVGAAYGRALSERDEARAQARSLAGWLQEAQDLLGYAVENWPETSWAQDDHAKAHLVQGIETLKAVDSGLTPAQED